MSEHAFPFAKSDDDVGLHARAQDRAPLSWTNERADTFFVCE